MKVSQGTWILAGLTVATSGLAVVMATKGLATWLEAVSFVTGAVCVWLTVKESVWNFPISLLNVMTFCVVFFQAKLFADAGLQVVYFVLTLVGWYWWMFGGEKRTVLKITRASTLERAVLIGVAAVMTFVLWETVHYFGGAASFWDALTTAMSLSAQWLLNRKKLENWVAWIVVDVIYVPLYVYKGLHLTAILYTVFLVMAVMGFLQWQATWRKRTTVEVRGLEGAAEVRA